MRLTLVIAHFIHELFKICDNLLKCMIYFESPNKQSVFLHRLESLCHQVSSSFVNYPG